MLLMQTLWVVRTAEHLKKPLSEANIMETDLETGCKQYTEVPRVSKKAGMGTKLVLKAYRNNSVEARVFTPNGSLCACEFSPKSLNVSHHFVNWILDLQGITCRWKLWFDCFGLSAKEGAHSSWIKSLHCSHSSSWHEYCDECIANTHFAFGSQVFTFYKSFLQRHHHQILSHKSKPQINTQPPDSLLSQDYS